MSGGGAHDEGDEPPKFPRTLQDDFSAEIHARQGPKFYAWLREAYRQGPARMLRLRPQRESGPRDAIAAPAKEHGDGKLEPRPQLRRPRRHQIAGVAPLCTVGKIDAKGCEIRHGRASQRAPPGKYAGAAPVLGPPRRLRFGVGELRGPQGACALGWGRGAASGWGQGPPTCPAHSQQGGQPDASQPPRAVPARRLISGARGAIRPAQLQQGEAIRPAQFQQGEAAALGPAPTLSRRRRQK